MRALKQLPISAALILLLCSCRHVTREPDNVVQRLGAREIAMLNQLRDEINVTYGFVDGSPRVNRGPCGRFAKIFREQWNARFKEKIHIAFVMMPDLPDGVGCDHVVVRLADGSYFDGGNGVISGPDLLKQFRSGDRIEEMVQFDLALLDKRSYGLARSYGLCPNYSDEITVRIIQKHLALIPRD